MNALYFLINYSSRQGTLFELLTLLSMLKIRRMMYSLYELLLLVFKNQYQSTEIFSISLNINIQF